MDSCIFCKIVDGQIPSTTIFEDENVKVILDIAPAAKGHAILLVKQHVANVFELDAETAGRVFSVVPKVAKALKEELGCDGMNILQNNALNLYDRILEVLLDKNIVKIQQFANDFVEQEKFDLMCIFFETILMDILNYNNTKNNNTFIEKRKNHC